MAIGACSAGERRNASCCGRASAADRVGSYAVITHPLDDQVRGFYARFHFADLPGDPKRAMLVRISELAATGFAQ